MDVSKSILVARGKWKLITGGIIMIVMIGLLVWYTTMLFKMYKKDKDNTSLAEESKMKLWKSLLPLGLALILFLAFVSYWKNRNNPNFLFLLAKRKQKPILG